MGARTASGRERRGARWSVGRRLCLWARRAMRERAGQASVEYALVVAAFLAAVLACALVWHAARDGSLDELARKAASHVVGEGGLVGAVRDIALF